MFLRWPAYAKCHLEIPRSSYVLFLFCCVGVQRSKISAQMFICRFSSFCCVCMCLFILSFCLFTTEVTCLATSESNCILKSGVQWGRVLAWLEALQLWRRLLPWPNRKSQANGCFFLGGMLIFHCSSICPFFTILNVIEGMFAKYLWSGKVTF